MNGSDNGNGNGNGRHRLPTLAAVLGLSGFAIQAAIFAFWIGGVSRTVDEHSEWIRNRIEDKVPERMAILETQHRNLQERFDGLRQYVVDRSRFNMGDNYPPEPMQSYPPNVPHQ